MAFLNYNLYLGIEKGRIGLQTIWGISSMVGEAPLFLPYLNRNFSESREVERDIEESGFYLFDQVLPEGSSSSGSTSTVSVIPNSENNPFTELLNAGIRITVTF